MLLRCWTEESVVLDSSTYQAPFPRGGVEGYPAWRTAEAAGAAGETDGNGRIIRTCVVQRSLPARAQTPQAASVARATRV
jgi:hypothetical protein